VGAVALGVRSAVLRRLSVLVVSSSTGTWPARVNVLSFRWLPLAEDYDHTRARFLGGLTVDGGAGSDTVNNIAAENDFPNGAPNIINI